MASSRMSCCEELLYVLKVGLQAATIGSTTLVSCA
jgi:hypothetical protein